MRHFTRWLSVFLIVSAGAVAQNELAHFDGTAEFIDRGPTPTAAKTLLQRIPADQLCGATTINRLIMILQDQNFATPEAITLEFRTSDPASPTTGSPDMTPAGLFGTLAGTLTFPTPTTGTVSAAIWTFTLTPPINIPVAIIGNNSVPGGDIYVGIALPAAPTWPATDGVSAQMSGTVGATLGEQMSPLTIGYNGTIGNAGLAYTSVTGSGVATLAGNNRSWAFRAFVAEDVLQPFAENAAAFTASPPAPAGTGTGLNPNFGYAGLFPDVARAVGSDNIGFRLRATAPIGSQAFFFLAFTPQTPTLNVGIGFLSIDINTMFPAPFTPLLQQATVAGGTGSLLTTSEAVFGPVPTAPSNAGVILYAQALTVDAITSGLRLSTMATMRL